MGIPGGIPERTSICATIDSATYGNGSTDATSAIQAALDSCPDGQVVYLPEGIYLTTDTIHLDSHATLRVNCLHRVINVHAVLDRLGYIECQDFDIPRAGHFHTRYAKDASFIDTGLYDIIAHVVIGDGDELVAVPQSHLDHIFVIIFTIRTGGMNMQIAAGVDPGTSRDGTGCLGGSRERRQRRHDRRTRERRGACQ
ncbi:MAG: hypothetical protein HGA82_00670 [Anaerolineales bacterium]|nr:hypothetical protein [Anaerolineales bacterium]